MDGVTCSDQPYPDGMTEDSFLLGNHLPPSPRTQRPAEPLWTVRRAGQQIERSSAVMERTAGNCSCCGRAPFTPVDDSICANKPLSLARTSGGICRRKAGRSSSERVGTGSSWNQPLAACPRRLLQTASSALTPVLGAWVPASPPDDVSRALSAGTVDRSVNLGVNGPIVGLRDRRGGQTVGAASGRSAHTRWPPDRSTGGNADIVAARSTARCRRGRTTPRRTTGPSSRRRPHPRGENIRGAARRRTRLRRR